MKKFGFWGRSGICCLDPALTTNEKAFVEERLKANWPDRWKDAGNNCFVVASDKPLVTKEISDLAGISDGNGGKYVVTKLDNYYGWADKSLWEWIGNFE